jgi:Domain of unknown function (DUF4129)
LALSAHCAVLQQLVPTGKVAPSSTPRDGLAQANAAVSSSAGLATLTSLVEETAFARRTPTLADLEQIRAQAGAASAAIAAAAPPAPRRRR